MSSNLEGSSTRDLLLDALAARLFVGDADEFHESLYDAVFTALNSRLESMGAEELPGWRSRTCMTSPGTSPMPGRFSAVPLTSRSGRSGTDGPGAGSRAAGGQMGTVSLAGAAQGAPPAAC